MEEPEKIENPETEELEEKEVSETEEPKDTETPERETKQEKKGPEVIARKARGYLAALIFTLGFGIFMAFIGAIIVVVGVVKGGNVPMYLFAAAMFLGGVGLTVYSGICIKTIRRIPQIIITHEGDTVNFFVTKTVSFSCKPSEITNVSYYQAYGRGQTRPWGTLLVYFGEKELRLVYIKDVVAAHNRLFALILEQKKTEEKQKTEEEQNSEETEKTEEIKTEENGENNG